jgi:phosphoglycerate dehydrogenase-like enzyme
LILMLLLVSGFSTLFTAALGYRSGQINLTNRVFNQLISIRASKAYQIESYFRNIQNHTQTLSEDELSELLPHYDGWIIGDDPATRRVFEAGQTGRLRAAVKWGIGVDKIDLIAAKERNVLVSITSGATSIPVSEHTLLLMLAVSRRLPLAHRSLGQGQWIAADLRTVCSKLDGKTVGLFGFGGIAQNVAKRLTGFDVEVIYHTRNRVAPEIENKLQARYVDFDTLVANSDILSLHAPLSPQTHHRFNADIFANMKHGAILINTARGELIDEPALIRALQQGQLSGAGLDTFEAEPPSANNPLFHMDQVVATPHSAGGVYDNLPNLVGHMFRNIQLFQRGLPIPEADLVVRRVD